MALERQLLIDLEPADLERLCHANTERGQPSPRRAPTGGIHHGE